MHPISRREFLKRAAAVAAGAYTGSAATAYAGMMGGGGMGGGGMGGGGSSVPSVIDPPPGPLFTDPPAAPILAGSPGSGFVDVAVDCRLGTVDVNGVPARLMTYNGQFPGPTLRAAKGDVLQVRFTNSLPMEPKINMLGHDVYHTNLHTHGLHVTPEFNPDGSPGDNVMLMFMPGEGETFRYDLSKQYPGTLNFYHPHMHGSVADQMWAGMAGCLVVEDDPGITALADCETHLMMLHDIDIVDGAPRPHTMMSDYMHGLEGQTVMVNGQVNPRLTIKSGQVQRWRVVNASNARFYKLSLQGHQLHVIGTEGGLLYKPYPVSDVLLAPGERLDLLVEGNQTGGSYKFLSIPYSRGGMSPQQTVTLLTLSYSGSQAKQSLPVTVDRDAKRLAMPSMYAERTLALSMARGRGYINGVTFEDHDHAYMFMSETGTHEVWNIVNQSGMDHPFHQHVNAAQVISISGGDAGYARLLTRTAAMKDVVIVPKWGSVRMLVPVMDYDGMTMVHCHIIEHEDIGMMGIWHIMPGGMEM